MIRRFIGKERSSSVLGLWGGDYLSQNQGLFTNSQIDRNRFRKEKKRKIGTQITETNCEKNNLILENIMLAYECDNECLGGHERKKHVKY